MIERHRTTNILAGLSLGLLLAGAAPADERQTSGVVAGMSLERLERLDEHFHRYVDDGLISGVVTYIVRHGEVVHEDAYGLADIAANRPMSQDTYFYVYSMTKPVTSVALLILYEEGKFQLDDPLGKYLPEMADLKLYAGDDANGNMILKDPARQPTIQDVFRHTAGFLYGPAGNRGIDRAYAEAGLLEGTLAELTRKLGKLPLAYEPGTQWIYSVSHDVQARLVEVLSGMPFDEFVRQRILEPLGMKNTVFGRPEALKDRFAVIYGRNQGGQLQPTGALDQPGAATRVLGGFSLSSTAADYARFAQMLVNSGELDGVRILSPAMLALARRNHTGDMPNQLYKRVAENAGWQVPPANQGIGFQVRGTGVFHHLFGTLASPETHGNYGAGSTMFWVDPERDVSFALCSAGVMTQAANIERCQKLSDLALSAMV